MPAGWRDGTAHVVLEPLGFIAQFVRHRVGQWCDAASRARADRQDALRGRCSAAAQVVLRSMSGARVGPLADAACSRSQDWHEWVLFREEDSV